MTSPCFLPLTLGFHLLSQRCGLRPRVWGRQTRGWDTAFASTAGSLGKGGVRDAESGAAPTRPLDAPSTETVLQGLRLLLSDPGAHGAGPTWNQETSEACPTEAEPTPPRPLGQRERGQGSRQGPQGTGGRARVQNTELVQAGGSRLGDPGWRARELCRDRTREKEQRGEGRGSSFAKVE